MSSPAVLLFLAPLFCCPILLTNSNQGFEAVRSRPASSTARISTTTTPSVGAEQPTPEKPPPPATIDNGARVEPAPAVSVGEPPGTASARYGAHQATVRCALPAMVGRASQSMAGTVAPDLSGFVPVVFFSLILSFLVQNGSTGVQIWYMFVPFTTFLATNTSLNCTRLIPSGPDEGLMSFVSVRGSVLGMPDIPLQAMAVAARRACPFPDGRTGGR